MRIPWKPFFNVKVYLEAPVTTADAIVEKPAPASAEDFAWDQGYITEVPPIMMSEPYFDIFGQTAGPVPYYYEEAVKLAGHSCGATTGAWTITRKALEALYPNGEIQCAVKLQWRLQARKTNGLSACLETSLLLLPARSPHTGFIGSEFGQTDNVFVRQNKMVYAEEPTNQLPPMREWVFTRLDTGAKVGVTFQPCHNHPHPNAGTHRNGKKDGYR